MILRSSISWLDSTDTDCGVSRRLVGVLEPTLTAPVVYEPLFSVISPMPWLVMAVDCRVMPLVLLVAGSRITAPFSIWKL